MELNISIGVRLKEERERLGYSQTVVAEIADRAGVKGATRQSQAMYEKGQRTPDAAFLAAIQEAGYDVLYILTGQRAAAAPPAPPLKPEEAALLDNYRHSPEEQQRLLRATSAAFAQPRKGKRSA